MDGKKSDSRHCNRQETSRFGPSFRLCEGTGPEKPDRMCGGISPPRGYHTKASAGVSSAKRGKNRCRGERRALAHQAPGARRTDGGRRTAADPTRGSAGRGCFFDFATPSTRGPWGEGGGGAPVHSTASARAVQTTTGCRGLRPGGGMRRNSRRHMAGGALTRLFRANPPPDPGLAAWAATLDRIRAVLATASPPHGVDLWVPDISVSTNPETPGKECHE